MTRNEEISRAAFVYFKEGPMKTRCADEVGFVQVDFISGVQWADEHPKNPWRSILDEMPPVKQTVLFLDTNGKPRLGYNNIDQKSATVGADSPSEKVTLQYWMPIPEAPKGGER